MSATVHNPFCVAFLHKGESGLIISHVVLYNPHTLIRRHIYYKIIIIYVTRRRCSIFYACTHRSFDYSNYTGVHHILLVCVCITPRVHVGIYAAHNNNSPLCETRGVSHPSRLAAHAWLVEISTRPHRHPVHIGNPCSHARPVYVRGVLEAPVLKLLPVQGIEPPTPPLLYSCRLGVHMNSLPVCCSYCVSCDDN